MALTATARGSGARNTGGETTYSITPASNFAVGERAVLCLSCDNAGTSGASPYSSVTDTNGNTWVARQVQSNDPGAASEGVTAAIYDCIVEFPITTSDTITVNFNATTVARSYALWEITSSTTGMIASPQYDQATGGTGSSTTPTKTTNKTVATNELVVGVMGAEYGDGTITEDADVSNGSWSASQEASVGTTTSGIEICSQTKVVTGNGTQTYNCTITSADWVVLIQIYAESFLSAQLIGVGSRNTGAETSYVITPNQTIRAGKLAVLCVSYDNSMTTPTAGGDPFSSIADSLGNSWYTADNALRDPGAANAGVATRVFYSNLKRTLTTSDTITVTFVTTTVARTYTLWNVEAGLGYYPAFFGNATQATGASTAPSVTRATGNTAGYLMFGVMGAEHNTAITGSDSTTSGSWSMNASAGVGTTTSGNQINTQTKYINADASITYANTITSADWTMQVVLFGARLKIPLSNINQAINRARTY